MSNDKKFDKKNNIKDKEQFYFQIIINTNEKKEIISEIEYKNTKECVIKENNKDNVSKEIKEKINLNNNLIIGYIKNKKNNLNQRIINSYENVKKEEPTNWYWENLVAIKNEEDIKDCEIFINDKRIDFINYFYEFPNEGTYIIKYKFKKFLTSTNFMFYKCHSLISLDFSNFNTKNVINMRNMFYGCNSLLNLNLSNFNTENVINMTNMFCNCYSLVSLDLSSFNTKNVTSMSVMFYHCESLTSINLSNFNIQNVINMVYMFSFCYSLTSIDLSIFKNLNKNVKNYDMFIECHSLTNKSFQNFIEDK